MEQTPLGINSLSSLLTNTGIRINANAVSHMGTSTNASTYTAGTLCTLTCLKDLTKAIRLAYLDPVITSSTYDNLLAIGATTIPALGNTKPSTYTGVFPYDKTNEITSHGFIRLFALQAYDEFNYNDTYAISGEYRDFLTSFTNAVNFIESTNSSILSISNSSTFLSGIYSNMDDLISSDISGVSLSTTLFGQDLIKLGKALDLASIATYGLPSNLLRTLNKYNAVTQSLSLALLASGLTLNDINSILNSTATVTQQRQLYGAFMIIVGQDLRDILIPLNCKTPKLETLADLLNPLKLFPLSYQTLTVPVYNTVKSNTNSKTYYPIYKNNGINSRLYAPQILAQIGSQTPIGKPVIDPATKVNTKTQPLAMGFGSYAQNILPTSIATAAGAVSVSLQQINNISKVPIEKFAQIVMSIETTKGLNLVSGTSVPVNVTLAKTAHSAIALGSGPRGTYTLSNFFGCMSGLPYAWSLIQKLILTTQTPTLTTIYSNLLAAVTASDDALTQTYITAANTEIAAILVAKAKTAKQLNALWDTCGKQLRIEQQSRITGMPVLPVPRDNSISVFPASQIGFSSLLSTYALDTEPHMTAQTLEAISDMATVGGQSIIGAMREARNKYRLAIVGINQDNVVPDNIPNSERTTLIANGVIPSTVPAYPVNAQAYGVYLPATNQYNITNNAFSTGIVDTGAVAEPGSFAGSPYQNLIPPALDAVYTSAVLQPASYTVPEAITQVDHCNCTCWV